MWGDMKNRKKKVLLCIISKQIHQCVFDAFVSKLYNVKVCTRFINNSSGSTFTYYFATCIVDQSCCGKIWKNCREVTIR